MVDSAGSVAVVGAGIIGQSKTHFNTIYYLEHTGVSTALEIQALIPGVQVTIFSEGSRLLMQ